MKKYHLIIDSMCPTADSGDVTFNTEVEAKSMLSTLKYELLDYIVNTNGGAGKTARVQNRIAHEKFQDNVITDEDNRFIFNNGELKLDIILAEEEVNTTIYLALLNNDISSRYEGLKDIKTIAFKTRDEAISQIEIWKNDILEEYDEEDKLDLEEYEGYFSFCPEGYGNYYHAEIRELDI